MNIFRFILIILGTLSLGIGILGIFIPGLPTTPFVLLTAGLYLRSSDRLYQRVIRNPLVGKYISDFEEHRGMRVKVKIVSISMMWAMIGCSCFCFIQNVWIDLALVLFGIIGTVVMGFLVNTIR